MKRETIERVGIGILSPIVVASILAFSTDFASTCSKAELEQVRSEGLQYTDKKLEEHEKVHNERDRQFEQIQSDLNIIKSHLINE